MRPSGHMHSEDVNVEAELIEKRMEISGGGERPEKRIIMYN